MKHRSGDIPISTVMYHARKIDCSFWHSETLHHVENVSNLRTSMTPAFPQTATISCHIITVFFKLPNGNLAWPHLHYTLGVYREVNAVGSQNRQFAAGPPSSTIYLALRWMAGRHRGKPFRLLIPMTIIVISRWFPVTQWPRKGKTLVSSAVRSPS